jgi:Flp pilus assembly pilin Flp
MVSNVALRMLTSLNLLVQKAKDEDGQTLAEYGLILSVVAVATIVLAVVAFRDAIATAFNDAIACLDGSC